MWFARPRLTRMSLPVLLAEMRYSKSRCPYLVPCSVTVSNDPRSLLSLRLTELVTVQLAGSSAGRKCTSLSCISLPLSCADQRQFAGSTESLSFSVSSAMSFAVGWPGLVLCAPVFAPCNCVVSASSVCVGASGTSEARAAPLAVCASIWRRVIGGPGPSFFCDMRSSPTRNSLETPKSTRFGPRQLTIQPDASATVLVSLSGWISRSCTLNSTRHSDFTGLQLGFSSATERVVTAER